jgi:hypothetical protein
MMIRRPRLMVELCNVSGSVRTGWKRSTVSRAGMNPSVEVVFSICRASAPQTAYPPIWESDQTLTEIFSGINAPELADVKNDVTVKTPPVPHGNSTGCLPPAGARAGVNIGDWGPWP